MLRDELDPALDRYSLQVLGYPHLPSEVRIEQDGELVVEFNGINLVDSATSLTGSMGFFRFRMELIEGLSPHRGTRTGTCWPMRCSRPCWSPRPAITRSL